MCMHVYVIVFSRFFLSKRYRSLFERSIIEKKLQAMATSNSLSILDIQMDHFGSSPDRIATKGLNSCVAIVVFLNPGGRIFVEHRSDVYFPNDLNLQNLDRCFENICKHIEIISPESNIQ
ncbi:unnamed protein product [Rotaria socialis]|uniref:Uncharacterized protein n=1 Tax=Rotaria socialis TaxID=392032 RepID=A0A818ZL22_9BILA|nr:unnamed protein product [Rotaria socialis]